MRGYWEVGEFWKKEENNYRNMVIGTNWYGDTATWTFSGESLKEVLERCHII
ncbi:MAG: hypothetical protein IJ629_00670 [Clostridia bacterium]|nr:hypothetical protein [Clostridia bacterium]